MPNYLVLSAIGKDRPGIVNQLSQMIVERQGNISSSRMMAMGGEFTIMLMIDGSPDTIEQIKASLPEMESQSGLTIVARNTELDAGRARRLPYKVEVVSMDHPGIVQQVADFFSNHEGNIEEMNTDTYAAAHTGTPMFALSMIVDLPAETRIAPLREEFFEFCDNLNLDASLEIP
ncbi:MAG: ACT domain-containing protein [Thioalkalispiraceae bacterium]|jgi:glycine cleavage system transcriptional repressor